MGETIAYLRDRDTGDYGSQVWRPCNDHDRLFRADEDSVVWHGIPEEVEHELRLRYPDESERYGRVYFHSDLQRVLVAPRPVFRAGPDPAADAAQLVSLAKRAGRQGRIRVVNAGAELQQHTPRGLCWVGNDGHYMSVVWDPARWAARVKRRREATVTLAELDEACLRMIDELLPRSDSLLWPVRHAIWEGDGSTNLHQGCLRFVGRVLILQKFHPARKLREVPKLRELLAKWKLNPAGNRQKFLRYGADGQVLVEWVERAARIRRPAEVPEPVAV